MGSLDSDAKLPWIKTPCLPSPQLSRLTGCNVFLKYENLQPSGSFKSRGIGNLMTQAAAAATGPVHFYCSSGGNAGLACATSAISLGQKATIVIPTIISPLMKGKLLDLGVEVHQKGKNWAECDKYMRSELVAKDPTAVYVPPFDHPRVWDGAATMVDEIRDQVEGRVDGIVCSVGGGGLVNGLMQGVESRPWLGDKPAVLAIETEGADSLNASVVAGEHVTLPEMTSIATSLGATRVSEQTWKWSQHPTGTMKSLVVSDADAAISAVRFADDARQLVEVACGAALAIAYRGDLRKVLGEGLSDEEWSKKNVVFVVCGGSGVTLNMLSEYREKYSGQSSIKV
ncbi:tryptophan synthase beta subunit-like PLP-dependent enzyme [Fusarium flagelliforme]|uniref:tryptophan synthase beta subunit-like PLP-dependent enzyme n=1 Tax=Fusarium flagelliforme TaxID=2675880 RepID=UPI001E8E5E27|nr:tryptophan synthase beta subunit-like PLP-dependent enzyme [Fusarium flagelliforme]KAH7188578.1 tryptophan synthase beta subunit-like PLP-dependent enzyme [Fusarium flagelliforme]